VHLQCDGLLCLFGGVEVKSISKVGASAAAQVGDAVLLRSDKMMESGSAVARGSGDQQQGCRISSSTGKGMLCCYVTR
jgi:hypothetical protein